MQYSLDGNWLLRFTFPGETEQRSLTAPVPGNVEPALEQNGLLTDCMPADNIHATTALNGVDDWTYIREFDAPDFADGWTQELVFEGIDTIAEIWLNGERLGETRDMFVPHRFDVRGRLRAHNELQVVIHSALRYAAGLDGDIFGAARDDTFYSGQPYLRKARHEWGWDNAPRLLTSGLYRSVCLESLPPERFDDVYLFTESVQAEQVSLGVHWSVVTPYTCTPDTVLRCTLTQDGRTLYESENVAFFPRGKFSFTVPRDQIRLWWPRGSFQSDGEAALCDVRLTFSRGGETRAEWTSKWGVRTIRLERTEDIDEQNNGDFVFWVNGERIYINGTNWKPLDALHSRADAKVERALDMVCDLNCNMVRIWGGGIYEETPFFDFCDRHGLLVWQDFMFACEYPPADEWYCCQVWEESVTIVRRQRNHPSLAVWCGDNEDDSSLSWSPARNSSILPSDNRINRKVLAECVRRYDPFRSYVPSSPYVSDAAHLDALHGVGAHATAETHFYPQTKTLAADLRGLRSRFIGETGPIIVNAMTDNERIFERERARAERLWDEPLPRERWNLRAHQFDDFFMSWRQCGKELCELWYGHDFGVAEWKEYSLAINFICADVFKDVIEFCRTDRPNKTGVIWWSLMDMWPMLFNYSVVDCDFRKKLPYYWIRQSQQAFALMAVRRTVGGAAALYAANGTMERHTGQYRVLAVDQSGNERVLASGAYSSAPNLSACMQTLSESAAPELWLIEWTENGRTMYNHFATQPKDSGFEAWKLWWKRLAALYGAEN